MSKKDKDGKKNKKSYYKNRIKRLEKYREYDRTVKLKHKYGITPEQWQEMFDVQKGCCAICGRHQGELSRRLSVDHCHTTNEVRGLLCTSCNSKLGWFEKHKNFVNTYLGLK